MKTNNKILTITIPSYNVEKYLPEVIPTYFADEVIDDIEILIVNDGSKDNTSKIAMDYVEMYPNSIKLINKENGGHGSTINVGIKNASGKYFKVIDGDDWVKTDELVKFVNVLKNRDEDLILNSFNKVNVDTGEVTIKRISCLEEGIVYNIKDVISKLKNNYQMHGFTIKTSIIKKIKKIDENCFYVDQEFILYPLEYIRDVVYYDIPLYQYRIGNSEQSMSLKNMQKNRGMHKRVIFSLINMLPINDVGIDEFIKFKAEKMSQFQIDIYFSLKSKEAAKKELFDFLYDIKHKSIDIYKGIPGKKMKLLRLSKNLGYLLICLSRRHKNED